MLAGLNDVVQERIGGFSEPVRGAGWDDDDVAFHQLTSLASLDGVSPHFIGGGCFHVPCGAAGNQRRGPLEDVDDVGIFGVDLSLAGLFSATCMDHVFPALVEQHRTLLEGGGDFRGGEIAHVRGLNHSTADEDQEEFC